MMGYKSDLICIIAHPDDETFCSGLLSELSSRGNQVDIVCLTRGEGGGLGTPPMTTTEMLGEVREQEMLAAARALGVRSVQFLDYVDPRPGPAGLEPPDHDPAVLQTRIADVIRELQPRAILTHGSNGEYGHPAHVLLNRITRSATAESGSNAPVYTFQAVHPLLRLQTASNDSDLATIIIDTSDRLPRKVEALLCHATQTGVFIGPVASESARVQAAEEYFRSRSLEGYRRSTPIGSQDDPVAMLADQRGKGGVSRLNEIKWHSRRLARNAARKLRQTARRFLR